MGCWVMTDENFDDSVRRALGVPTGAEKEEQTAARARAARAVADDLPRRQALILDFRNRVGNMVTAVFKDVQAVAQKEQARVELIKANVYSSCGRCPDDQNIFCHACLRRLGSRLGPECPDIPPLSFTLMLDGNLRIGVERGLGSTRSLSVNFVSLLKPIAEITMEHVQKAFVSYLTSVRQAKQAGG